MEFFLGFIIAIAISLTGVGAGSMTTPLLILLLRVPPATAVGVALAFGAIVKIACVPTYLIRRQVNVPTLRLLLAGGLPGVVLGSLVLHRLTRHADRGILFAAIGSLIAAMAVFQLYRVFRPTKRSAHNRYRWLLPWLALPIGVEVGFSSAGAGALGSLLLLGLTPLSTADVVGTDLSFGLILSLVGSFFQISAGNYDPALLLKLSIGGICGVLVGLTLAGRIAQRPLRIGLLLMLIVLGCQLARQGHGNSAPVPTLLQMSGR